MTYVIRIQRKGGQILHGFNVTLDPTQVQTDKDVLYIGRACFRGGWELKQSKWHNPFGTKRHGLPNSMQLYEDHIRQNLYNDLDELDGKILGCWCKEMNENGKPLTTFEQVVNEDGIIGLRMIENCHGDVLVRLLREKKGI